MAGNREDYLQDLYTYAGMCANCSIAEASNRDHDDCAGPEGYWCDCYCDGTHVESDDDEE